MAFEYQANEGFLPSSLGAKGEVLPEELSGAYLQQLDEMMKRQEKKQMESTLGDLENRGFLRSGDTFTKVSEDVLGPAVERRQQALLGEMRGAAQQGREERLGATGFERQKEMSNLESANRLKEIQAQAQVQRMLMELQNDLSGGGNIWASIGGQALGAFAGGLGGKAGGRLGGSLFGGK